MSIARNLTTGTRVRVEHQTGLIERGSIFGSSVEPITKVRSYTVHFDDDTFWTVQAHQCTPITALLRVTEWAERTLVNEPDVRFVRVVDTGGYNLAVEVTTHDARRYLVAFSRKNTGAGLEDAWTCDSEPNGDDCDTTAPTAVAAFRGERAADLAFAGGPLDRTVSAS